MEEGLIDATIMVAYIPQGPRDDASLLKATDFAMNRLQEIHRQMELNRTRMCIAYTPQEVHVLKAAGKKARRIFLKKKYLFPGSFHRRLLQKSSSASYGHNTRSGWCSF